MFLLLVAHNIFNRRWYGTITKGRHEPRGIVTKAINLSLLASMLTLLVTSVIISQTVFSFLPLNTTFTARQIHAMVAYLVLLIAAVHLGHALDAYHGHSARQDWHSTRKPAADVLTTRSRCSARRRRCLCDVRTGHWLEASDADVDGVYQPRHAVLFCEPYCHCRAVCLPCSLWSYARRAAVSASHLSNAPFRHLHISTALWNPNRDMDVRQAPGKIRRCFLRLFRPLAHF